MTDKEKQAIERCKQLTEVQHANWIGISNQIAIATALDLIEKQQAEIEVYKDIKELAGTEIKEILSWKYENKKMKLELEKKNKIIDEMADYMLTELNDKSLEKICKNYSCTYKWKDNKPTKARDCKGCIKEYFKKKVEDK